ncbi:MAG: multidrug efflux RND transporter permease subunit [Phycisphaeraceae bacterium]|nr:multidrug efflux RND transporter permease subunit [Phycisphaerae bacterium]MBX3391176.1 multidrug efflux RND transporter permease subunit [Phycisphaeraceae bacterium]
MLAEFPVRRPIVAMVLSILIVIMGLVAYPTLPIAQYPDITPPVVQVTTTFPGASAQVVADTVASPIEQQVNGVPGMLYMESTSASDGSYTLKVTFELGTNIDIASVLVQNRVNIASPKLPDEVKRQGVTTDRVSSNVITVLSLAPKDDQAAGKFDDLFIANYLTINVLDEIKRITGVGDAKIFPAKDYGIRLWLDPDRLKSRDLTTMDVINALKEQNVQVAAGAIGQPPVPAGQAFQYNVSTLGRLSDVEQFENVIVLADGNRIVRVKDVARVELGGKSYDLLARYKGTPAAAMVVYQAPGGNAVQVADDVRKLLEVKGKSLPDGLAFESVYDTSEFVLSAIEAVYHTFFEALVLVLAVVLVFLGSIRLSLIPMLAIPVSIIGTFFFAKMLGFSVNMPVLFGLVVAIGIVVDDAIVVVENVERVMVETHLPPKEATVKAMKEVLAPVMSITLVLMAVFVPTAFLPGISGQLFRQFALTIAASTFLSGVCAVTLTPALCGVILRPHKAGKKPFILVRLFNQGFDALANGYARLVKFLVHPAVVVFTLASFGACVVGIGWTFTKVPTGFVPLEDRGMVMVEVWMPDSSSQERTVAAVEKVEKILSETDGVRNYTALPGFSMINNNGSNYALFFIGLEDWSVRLPKGRDLNTIMADLRQKTARIPDGLCIVFSLPAVDGVGSASGFDLRLQDRGGIGRPAMGELVQSLVQNGNAQSKLRGVNSAYRAAVPQLFADVDREKVKKLGIPLQDVFSTMSGYLASAYVNDFNLFGRTWQVNVSADSRFRAQIDDIKRLDVRKPDGSMVPLGSLLSVRESLGADRVIRYNIFPAAVLQGQPAPGISSGEALKVVENMAEQTLPPGTSYEWTALSYQEKIVGNQAIIVFSMALLVVYLLLAALYESWFVPLSVVLSIPLAVLGAMLGLMWRGMDNNIYTQVGLVLLVGLGAKNAILIVEFAKAYREQGKGIVESAVEASRQRLRPILMTALAFILGVLPLMIATGAGAASRQAIGTAVFFGMIGNTFLGLIFTPVLYVVIQATTEKLFGVGKPHAPAETTAPVHA